MADPGPYEVSELLEGEKKGPRDGANITFSPRTSRLHIKPSSPWYKVRYIEETVLTAFADLTKYVS